MPDQKDSAKSVDAEVRTIPQIQVMSPAKGTKPRREPRDTGFPEPFDEARNTTLPHPDADLSPNATISFEDVAVDRAFKRHKLSFLNKHRKTLAHGTISPEMEALHSSLSLSPVDTDSANKEPSKVMTGSTYSLRLSKDGAESVRSKKLDEDTPPTSPDVSEHRRKKGLLGKLRRKS